MRSPPTPVLLAPVSALDWEVHSYASNGDWRDCVSMRRAPNSGIAGAGSAPV